MSQNIINITNVNLELLPYPIRQKMLLTEQWAGTPLGNGRSLLSCSLFTTGALIKEVIEGYSLDNMILTNVYYNNPDKFGGQSVPVTAYLSPASDDSWKPRYQAPFNYGKTTQVFTQQLPLMTHIIRFEDAITNVWGVFPIVHVIDDSNMFVDDPLQKLNGFIGDFFAVNMNVFGALNVNIQAASGTVCEVYTAKTSSTFTGPFNIDFGPNQNGIVEPFIVNVPTGTVIATTTY